MISVQPILIDDALPGTEARVVQADAATWTEIEAVLARRQGSSARPATAPAGSPS